MALSLNQLLLVTMLTLALLKVELSQCQFMTALRHQQLPKLGKRYVGGVFLAPKVEIPAQRVPWLYDSRLSRPALVYFNRMSPAGYRAFGWRPSSDGDQDKFDEAKRMVYWNLE